MPSLLIQLLVLGLAVVHLRASQRTSSIALLASVFLVPGALATPGAPGSMLVLRVGLWAAALGIILRASRGDLDPRVIRPSRPLVALAAFVAVAYAVGVAAATTPSIPRRSLDLWLLLFDQMVFLWVATVIVRSLGVRWVAKVAATLTVGVAVIGIAEHFLGTSYARWWYRGQLDGAGVSAQTLELRGSNQRSRATADFALQYAWVLGFFLPMVTVLALRAKRLVAMVFPALVVLAIVYSITRSVYAGIALSAAILLLVGREERRVVIALAVAGGLAAFLYLGLSTVRDPYAAASPDSLTSRERRLEIIAAEVADTPWFGIGLDGLLARQFRSTDTAYLQMYAGSGVVGVTVLIGALGTALATAASGLARLRGDDALLGAAVVGGIASGFIAAFSLDSLSGPLASWSFWLLAALGVGMAERAGVEGVPPATTRGLRRSPWRLLLPVGGLLVGLAVYATATPHVAVHLRMSALAPGYQSQDTINDGYVGELITNSICTAARATLPTTVRLDCRNPANLGPGTGSVRLEAATVAEVMEARRIFERTVTAVHPPTQHFLVQGPKTGRSTWAATAPGWATLFAAEVALLVPPIKVRSRSRTRPGSPPEEGGPAASGPQGLLDRFAQR